MRTRGHGAELQRNSDESVSSYSDSVFGVEVDLKPVKLRKSHAFPRQRNFEVPTNVGRAGEESAMAKRAKKKTRRGRKQDRARVAGGQDYEVRYEAKKTGKSNKQVKG